MIIYFCKIIFFRMFLIVLHDFYMLLIVLTKNFFVNPCIFPYIPQVSNPYGDKIDRLFLFLVFQWYICTLIIIFSIQYTMKRPTESVLIFLCMTFMKKNPCTYIQIAHDKKGNPSPTQLVLPRWYVPACKWQVLKQNY